MEVEENVEMTQSDRLTKYREIMEQAKSLRELVVTPFVCLWISPNNSVTFPCF
jgi:hypothetical protein